MSRLGQRNLNPWAWWLWALGIAAAVGLTTNPVVLVLAIVVLWLTVTARRGNSPWAKTFRMYLWLAGFVVGFRVLMHVLVGMKSGSIVLMQLPAFELPSWAAGINVLGTIYAESLLFTALDGLRLGTILIAIGAANTLANPTQLVRSLPAALGEVGTAIVIALSLAPQMAEALVRVNQARQLRGDEATGLRGFRRLVIPVLQDTLDGALQLAASMDSRGYGRRALLAPRQRQVSTAVAFAGLVGLCVGVFFLLDSTLSPGWNLAVTAAGAALVALALRLEGRRATTTRYNAPEWKPAEWLVIALGAGVLAATVTTRFLNPTALSMPIYPLSALEIPLLPVVALLAASLAAFLTPAPAPAPVRTPRRSVPDATPSR